VYVLYFSLKSYVFGIFLKIYVIVLYVNDSNNDIAISPEYIDSAISIKSSKEFMIFNPVSKAPKVLESLVLFVEFNFRFDV